MYGFIAKFLIRKGSGLEIIDPRLNVVANLKIKRLLLCRAQLDSVTALKDEPEATLLVLFAVRLVVIGSEVGRSLCRGVLYPAVGVDVGTRSVVLRRRKVGSLFYFEVKGVGDIEKRKRWGSTLIPRLLLRLESLPKVAPRRESAWLYPDCGAPAASVNGPPEVVIGRDRAQLAACLTTKSAALKFTCAVGFTVRFARVGT